MTAISQLKASVDIAASLSTITEMLAHIRAESTNPDIRRLTREVRESIQIAHDDAVDLVNALRAQALS